MIKAIVFDMDGVLIDAKEWHYEALNRALSLFGYGISRYDHLTSFDGLPTSRKLEMLSVTTDLPRQLHPLLNKLKQAYTMEAIHQYCRPRFTHEYALAGLKAKGYKLAVASNSIRATVDVMMDRSDLARYLDVTLSNEDVARAKPDPEIYIAAMSQLGVGPAECLIVEDNENGIKAARSSGAHVLVVANVGDVNRANIDGAIRRAEGES